MNKNKISALYTSRFQLLGHNGPIYALSQHADHLYSASSDKLVVRWNLTDGTQDQFVVKTERPAFSILKLQYCPQLVIGQDDGSLHIIDVEQRTEIRHLKVHQHAVFSIAENQTKGQRYTTDAAGNLLVWDDSWNLLLTMPLDCGKIRSLQLSPDGHFLFLACGNGKLKLLDTEFLNQVNEWTAHQEACTALCLLPNQTILSGGKDGYIRHWSPDGELLKFFPAHKGTIYGLARLNDELYASVSRDKTIKIWQNTTHQIFQKIEVSGRAHLHSINALVACDNQMITAGDDKRIHVWSQKT
ncbi:MAG: WD40 repeat domain-containing protein [Flavobacteriales bacterium]